MKITDYLSAPALSSALFNEVFSRFPMEGIHVPPASFIDLQGKIVEYTGKSMVTVFPVLPRQTNPIGILQGGILTAFMDDTIGPLSYLTAKKPVVTLNFTMNFIRNAKPGDSIIVRAELVSRSLSTLFFKADAFNQSGKLVGTMTSQNLILRGKE